MNCRIITLMTNKTQLQHLQDLYSAAHGLAVEYQAKAEKIKEQINIETWRIAGIEIGDWVESGGAKALVSGVSLYFLEGSFIKKDGEASTAKRYLYNPILIKKGSGHEAQG